MRTKKSSSFFLRPKLTLFKQTLRMYFSFFFVPLTVAFIRVFSESRTVPKNNKETCWAASSRREEEEPLFYCTRKFWLFWWVRQRRRGDPSALSCFADLQTSVSKKTNMAATRPYCLSVLYFVTCHLLCFSLSSLLTSSFGKTFSQCHHSWKVEWLV